MGKWYVLDENYSILLTTLVLVLIKVVYSPD